MKPKIVVLGMALITTMSLFVGCGTTKQTLVTINRTPYEKLAYETTEVQKGDLEPELKLKLREEGYEKVFYDVTNEELQLDKVHVSVGDRVQKGDILVSFKSESIQESIDTYEGQKSQNQLLLDHYVRLMQIDSTVDYSQDITMLQNDIEVASLYIAEAKEKLSRYQVVAQDTGTITEMNSSLQNGIYAPGHRLITEVCGTGNYQAERPEGYEFKIGETYTAEAGINSYELQVAEVTENAVIFTPVSDMSSITEGSNLSVTVKQPVLTNAIYVKASAVLNTEESYFVYVQNEDGYREAVPVTIGERVGEYQIITSGLSGGEKVTLK